MTYRTFLEIYRDPDTGGIADMLDPAAFTDGRLAKLAQLLEIRNCMDGPYDPYTAFAADPDNVELAITCAFHDLRKNREGLRADKIAAGLA